MGPNIPGQLLVLWAFGANIVAGVAFFMAARGKARWESLARFSYLALTAFTTLAVAYLFYLFFSHNFAIQYVFEYSDRSLPFFFLLSAFWGGQAGTYLLWLFLNVLFGFIILYRGGRYTLWGMTILALVNLFFTSILIKLSPFALLNFVATDGAGLNPLLQDAWMVVHPPIMFIGYSMAAIPFALAMAALITNDYTHWVKRVFPWAAITALMLAAGNILGGYWAYKTLGWGGFWAWDPVENSSLIPWFMSLALLHGLIIERRTAALRKINILLTAFVFWLVVYGTFLTRSGVLADFSVHSFVDLGQNLYLVGALLLYGLLAVVLFIPRIKAMGVVPLNYHFFGREFSLFAAMVLLFMFSIIVLFWSSLPILTKLVGADPRAADIMTYNSFALPLGAIYGLLLLLSPLTTYATPALGRWQLAAGITFVLSLAVGVLAAVFSPHGDMVFAVLFTIVMTGLAVALSTPSLVRRLVPAIVLFLLTGGIAIALGVKNYTYILFFAVAAGAFGSNMAAFFRLLPGQARLAGAHLTHFGFGLMLIGVLASSAFDSSDRIALTQHQPETTYGLEVTYDGMAQDIEFPHNELILTIVDGEKENEARPELYYSKRMDGLMKRPYIRRTLLHDLYFSPQDIRQADAGEGLMIGAGKSASVGGYEFQFDGFEMGDHSSGANMKVTVHVIASRDGMVDTLHPAVAMVDGSGSLMDMPAEFGDNQNYQMSILKILADQDAVIVDIPGLLETQPDRLLMDVSYKPLINFVWAGTTLIMLGIVIVFFRRRREAAA